MTAGEPPTDWRALAGVHSGDGRLAARVGTSLSALPGRWRWAIERLLRWWFAELAGLAGRHRAAASRSLVVGEADTLDLVFAMPAEALGLVEERVALMIAAQTPLAANEVLAAYRLDADGPAVRVLARLVPIERFAAIAAGSVAERVLLQGHEDGVLDVRVPLALLSAGQRRDRARAQRGHAVVAAALLLAMLLPLVVPLWVRSHMLAREQASLEEDRRVLSPLLRKAGGTRAMERASAAAWRLAATAPAPLPVLDRLTARLDDDVYLAEFRLSAGEGTIAGFASDAAALAGPLEADPQFADVRLTAPVSREGAEARQRFEIGFRVAAR